METYAAELQRGLEEIGDGAFRFEPFRPHYPGKTRAARRWTDRWARYVSYPLQVRGRSAGLNHIVDHAYAHLMMSLPPSRTIVTVHDMIPFLAARGVLDGRRHHRPWLNEFTLSFLKRARALVADSESTRRDLIAWLDVPEGRVRTIALGLSPVFRVLADSKERLRRKLGLPPDARLLLITGGQFYKNHSTSIEVLNRVRQAMADANVHLVCMGRLSDDARQLAARRSLEPFVLQRQPEGRDAVVELYNAVDCLLFPSLYEGFGWPPLEAMACGIPVVCSNAGSLLEVVDDAAFVSEPLDVDALAASVIAVLTGGESIRRARERGFARAAIYRWSRCADEVLDVYRSALS